MGDRMALYLASNSGRARYRDLFSASLAALIAAAMPAIALAQAAPAPPTRGDLDLGRDNTPDQRASRLTVEGDIDRGPCPLADPSFAGTRVTFSSVDFSGLPGIDASVLAPAWTDLAGRDQPIAALCDVRDRAATILRNMGFLAAVQVPPQRIEAGGTVHMDVLAAKLVEVQLRGDAGNSGATIAANLGHLTERPYFNTREAERALLLMGDLPGYDVRLVLRSAGRGPGEVVGDVVITRTPYDLIAGVQNLGSPSNGRWGAFAALTVNDVLGLGDTTTVSYYNTFDLKEQRIFRASHELALGYDGLRLGGSLLLGHSEPDLGGAAFVSQTLAAEGHLSYPFIRQQRQTLLGTVGFEWADQDLNFGSTPLSRDHLRVVYGRLSHEMIDEPSLRGRDGYSARLPRWHTRSSLELRQGLNGLGASDACNPLAVCLPPNIPISNFAADPSSFVARFEGLLEFRPVPLFTIALAPMVQFSDGPLLSYEQASLGNYSIGRGYDPGVALGDRAAGTSVEMRYGYLNLDSARLLAIEPFVFLDIARAWLDDSLGAPDPRNVLSVGGGVRGHWRDRIDFGVTFAAPLKRAGYQTSRPDPRVLFTITARLLPWGDL